MVDIPFDPVVILAPGAYRAILWFRGSLFWVLSGRAQSLSQHITLTWPWKMDGPIFALLAGDEQEKEDEKDGWRNFVWAGSPLINQGRGSLCAGQG